MDPLRIAVRVAFTFVLVLILVRTSGKRTVLQGDMSSFIVALVLGDLFDDMFWAEVPVSEFVVAAGTILTVHMVARTTVATSGTRDWLRVARGRGVRS
jgi:uncharacterized membrane protein YcaP (DUF421 family)